MTQPKLHPAQAKPRRRRTLRPEDVDKVGDALLTLAKELWVVKDRQMLLEEILKRHQIDVAREIDKLVPDADLEARLKAEREALIRKLMNDLVGES